ncbi:hypothetical protein SAMN05216419_100310 [Nitrosomonas cryotolerans]|uniref:DUF2325 domain-containing protein n=1 Tax=Nitrosomonas cryotolerans ATCC 49181 TaxID=1131553 RepID=A0A1N6J9E8_9PROT|nr:DUF2325 domain-containing protein [Nitrosomonas cryotolerans]SFP44083.1 hypothetical protein SAMN05216419_100310 [Nitrosomonas cryotolerans]SIO40801.1 hypothetical protein SAMN02743940_2409 [Nitrosomonas cryotolerans ATCC 49181]
MRILKKSTLSVISPLSIVSLIHLPNTTHTDNLLSACLRGADRLYRHLYHTIFNDNCHNHFDSTHIPRLFRKQRYDVIKPVSEINRASRKSASVTSPLSLIKATTHIKNNDISKQNPSGYDHHQRLSGKSVLCVGGRAALYPRYRYLVETSGGIFLSFHGNSSDNIERLFKLLAYTNMVICPVDCVNHDAYLTVQHYCRHSGKPCALLERSEIATFRKGIEILAMIATKQPILSENSISQLQH